ncbi:MAG: YHYH protein [Woeseia sp.]
MKALLFVMFATSFGCSSSGGSDSAIVIDGDLEGVEGLDPTLFVSGALVSEVTTESCVLSGGTQTTCYRIEIPGVPADRDIGPFCPPTIFSTAQDGGIWFDGGGDVYDIDGDFIVNLMNLYGDQNWLLYDPNSGNVNVTDTQVACEAAARPNVDPQYQNHCVECAIEYYGGGVSQTFLIPATPVALSSPGNLGRGDLGVTLDGVVLAPPAPVDAILGAYTIAAFDDCGGHVNPVEGYHYHAATGCTELVAQNDGHAALIGYAIDGYALHGMMNEDLSEPTDLDGCRGHTDDVRGYHYHAASAGENMFIGCFNGEQGSVL